jgi:hypothetical protein
MAQVWNQSGLIGGPYYLNLAKPIKYNDTVTILLAATNKTTVVMNAFDMNTNSLRKLCSRINGTRANVTDCNIQKSKINYSFAGSSRNNSLFTGLMTEFYYQKSKIHTIHNKVAYSPFKNYSIHYENSTMRLMLGAQNKLDTQVLCNGKTTITNLINNIYTRYEAVLRNGTYVTD